MAAGRGGGVSLDKLSISAILEESDSNPLPLWQSIAIGSVLLTLILCCVVGNFFVIMAILLERDLRRPQYYLIFSLACADLLVGLVVTPLGAWSTIRRAWNLGVHLCDFWISMDVLVCTSSILHLVAIALDR
jgi:5-hydroxytryptamine receptor 1